LPVLSSSRPLLEVRDLCVSYGRGSPSGPGTAMSGFSFEIYPGEILGIQGRSGCGKTTTALAILKLLPADARVSGSILFEGKDLLQLSERELRGIRGKEISIIYQEPTLALNPVMRVGDQIAEVARAHGFSESKAEATRMLERVGLEPKRYYVAYSHELSGGELHRVVVAQALICRPRLVIADEPTASLDPALKNEVLALIDGLRQELGTAFLLISHDAGVISKIADRVTELPEQKVTATHELLLRGSSDASFPTEHRQSQHRQSQEPLLAVRNLCKRYCTRGLFAFGRSEKQALDSVEFKIYRGTLTALIGPSGSGKSTLARCLALLEEADSGEILLEGKNLLTLSREELRKYRAMVQYVTQDPAAALNPRLTAAQAIEEPLLIQRVGNQKQRRRTAEGLMHRVGLDPLAAQRFCHEFSGGQKHRLVIARALALQPKLLIFDESLAGLDLNTRAEILTLLGELRDTLGIAQLLISHDLELVSSIAEKIAVMRDGQLVEECAADGVLDNGEQWRPNPSLEVAPKRELVLADSE
jgi:ABC-type glutathione transport system ATPase component